MYNKRADGIIVPSPTRHGSSYMSFPFMPPSQPSPVFTAAKQATEISLWKPFLSFNSLARHMFAVSL